MDSIAHAGHCMSMENCVLWDCFQNLEFKEKYTKLKEAVVDFKWN